MAQNNEGQEQRKVDGKENESNTPDFILAQYLESCLTAFNTATQQRENWYGRDPRPNSISSRGTFCSSAKGHNNSLFTNHHRYTSTNNPQGRGKMKPSERIYQLVKEEIKGSDGLFLSIEMSDRITLKMILRYLDEQSEKERHEKA